jgi:hypothetical protein
VAKKVTPFSCVKLPQFLLWIHFGNVCAQPWGETYDQCQSFFGGLPSQTSCNCAYELPGIRMMHCKEKGWLVKTTFKDYGRARVKVYLISEKGFWVKVRNPLNILVRDRSWVKLVAWPTTHYFLPLCNFGLPVLPCLKTIHAFSLFLLTTFPLIFQECYWTRLMFVL